MRIVDVQQILMQEPRAAFKNAQLIAVDEQMKQVVKELQQREQQRKRKTVTKVTGTESRERVQDLQGKKKTIRHSGMRRNSITKHKIDYTI